MIPRDKNSGKTAEHYLAKHKTAKHKTAKYRALYEGMIGVALVMLFGFSQLTVAEEESKNPNIAWGKDIYMGYCASCHGESGKGDGPAAAGLKAFPLDLTYVSLRNGGDFPRDLVEKYIDGGQLIPVHGSRQMPVWGKVFRRDSSDTEARMQISALSAYLESIQSNPAP